MTVAELIAKLQEMPGELEVTIPTDLIEAGVVRVDRYVNSYLPGAADQWNFEPEALVFEDHVLLTAVI